VTHQKVRNLELISKILFKSEDFLLYNSVYRLLNNEKYSMYLGKTFDEIKIAYSLVGYSNTNSYIYSTSLIISYPRAIAHIVQLFPVEILLQTR